MCKGPNLDTAQVCKDRGTETLETAGEMQQRYIAGLALDETSNVMGLFTNPMSPVAKDNSQ